MIAILRAIYSIDAPVNVSKWSSRRPFRETRTALLYNELRLLLAL